ncbi:MAG: tRNA epoxyqueuosine(34) reductase QueG [Candidatus Acidiferrum sp.]
MKNSSETAWIIEQAIALGFDLCGVVRAEKFPELDLTKEWLALGYAGEMKYLSDQRRCDPPSVMPGLRSVIVCALNYNSSAPRSMDAFQMENAESHGWISRYAWGDDYHEVLQKKLQKLASSLPERFTESFEARVYADTGPLNERVFAKHAGLGWLGKNTLLLNQKLGSCFFLGVILTTLDLPPTLGPADSPPADLCGSCTKCIDACPTGALVEPYVMDSRLCISYLTIELRGSIPEELREPMSHHVFGCDICQDVCPWNRRAPVTQSAEFQPRTLPHAPQASREGYLRAPWKRTPTNRYSCRASSGWRP